LKKGIISGIHNPPRTAHFFKKASIASLIYKKRAGACGKIGEVNRNYDLGRSGAAVKKIVPFIASEAVLEDDRTIQEWTLKKSRLIISRRLAVPFPDRP